MSQVIIAPYGETIAIVYPTSETLTVDEVAKAALPVGVPYLIVDSSEIPEDPTYRDAWTADFSSPDGYGEAAIETAAPIEN